MISIYSRRYLYKVWNMSLFGSLVSTIYILQPKFKIHLQEIYQNKYRLLIFCQIQYRYKYISLTKNIDILMVWYSINNPKEHKFTINQIQTHFTPQ